MWWEIVRHTILGLIILISGVVIFGLPLWLILSHIPDKYLPNWKGWKDDEYTHAKPSEKEQRELREFFRILKERYPERYKKALKQLPPEYKGYLNHKD